MMPAKGRGFARAGRAADQDEPVLQLGKAVAMAGKPKLFEHRDLVLDDAEHGRQARQLVEDVGAKAQRLGFHVDGEIHVAHRFQLGELLLGKAGPKRGCTSSAVKTCELSGTTLPIFLM
jgi:hypothetical protein